MCFMEGLHGFEKDEEKAGMFFRHVFPTCAGSGDHDLFYALTEYYRGLSTDLNIRAVERNQILTDQGNAEATYVGRVLYGWHRRRQKYGKGP